MCHDGEGVYCKPRQENVPLIITNLAWVLKMLEFVGVNVLSSAHVRIYTSEKCPFVVGWLLALEVPKPLLASCREEKFH